MRGSVSKNGRREPPAHAPAWVQIDSDVDYPGGKRQWAEFRTEPHLHCRRTDVYRLDGDAMAVLATKTGRGRAGIIGTKGVR